MRVTPPLGARGPAYGGEYYSHPHSLFGLVARLSATHKRAQTVYSPPESPTRERLRQEERGGRARAREREKFIDNQ